MIEVSDCLLFSTTMFVIGVAGLLINRKNLLVCLMCIEILLLAVNTNFIVFSSYWDDIRGQVFVFFVLTIAAAEAAIGLAILVVLFRKRKSINIDRLNLLQG